MAVRIQPARPTAPSLPLILLALVLLAVGGTSALARVGVLQSNLAVAAAITLLIREAARYRLSSVGHHLVCITLCLAVFATMNIGFAGIVAGAFPNVRGGLYLMVGSLVAVDAPAAIMIGSLLAFRLIRGGLAAAVVAIPAEAFALFFCYAFMPKVLVPILMPVALLFWFKLAGILLAGAICGVLCKTELRTLWRSIPKGAMS